MSTATRRSLYGKMAGDTTLTNMLATPASGYAKAIYFQLAPQGAATPYVIFSKQSGVPIQAFGDPSALDTDVWLVKAVDKNTTADTAEAITARVTALLNDATLMISGLTHVFLRRQSDVQYVEVDAGVAYQHAGSLYRLVTTD